MSTKKRFSPRIDGLEARVVLTHPSTQELVADVRRVAESLQGALPLTSSTLFHALAKKPAELSIEASGQLGSLYNEIEGSSSLQQFAANVFESAPAGPTSGSSQLPTLNSSADLNDSINNMADVAYQVQKNADGSGTINLNLEGTYNPSLATFENLALSDAPSWRLARAIHSIGQHWSRIIHPYAFQIPVTYSEPASGGSGPQPPASNFPVGTYRGSYSTIVTVRDLDTGAVSSVNAAGTIMVTINSHDSTDGLSSGSITITNFAGQTFSAPIQGNIAEGRDIDVLAFQLGYSGNSGNLSVDIDGTFQGTTMVVTTSDAEIVQGPDDDSTISLSPNGVLDLAAV
jgi:hypothetical protein